jgi:membrane protein DedA with SNARE-associated domain
MKKSGKLRGALLAITAVRVVIGVLAIPLAPFLYEEHFLVLVLMRPTKEVLLAAGFLIRLGKIWWVPVIAAAVPLAILGVWQFYYLGRQYASEIRAGSMPWWAQRILPPKKVKVMQGLLKKKGMKLILLGRLAVFPSSVVAAAAGSGDVPSRRFLPADLAGGLLSILEVIGAGFALGYAYKRAGPWITVGGVVALAAIGFVVARGLRREGKRQAATGKRRSGKKGQKGQRGRGRRGARATSRS